MIERFTPADADTIVYRFTVDDPDTWTKPWSGELIMKKTTGPIYEYACHEGNYGLVNMLTTACAAEKAKAGKPKLTTRRGPRRRTKQRSGPLPFPDAESVVRAYRFPCASRFRRILSLADSRPDCSPGKCTPSVFVRNQSTFPYTVQGRVYAPVNLRLPCQMAHVRRW